MLGDARLYDEPAQTHLIEWHSGKIQRKVASTLASEANAASQAYDRAMWARAIMYEIEQGKDSHWEDMCKKIPFCLGTDCKSLYDNIIKPSSTTKEKRVALDLLDVREGIERMGDQIRWVPTDHMLVDSLTKCMNPALLLKYLADYTYSFKYDDVITETKRFAAKQRKEARDKKISDNKAKADTQRKSNTPKRKADDSDDSEEEDQNQVGAVKRHFVGFVFGIDPSYSSSCSKTDNRCVHVPLDQLSTTSSSDNHNNKTTVIKSITLHSNKHNNSDTRNSNDSSDDDSNAARDSSGCAHPQPLRGSPAHAVRLLGSPLPINRQQQHNNYNQFSYSQTTTTTATS